MELMSRPMTARYHVLFSKHLHKRQVSCAAAILIVVLVDCAGCSILQKLRAGPVWKTLAEIDSWGG